MTLQENTLTQDLLLYYLGGDTPGDRDLKGSKIKKYFTVIFNRINLMAR